MTLYSEETRIKITPPYVRTDLERKVALSWWQTQAFNLHRSHAQSGIFAGCSLWVFFATGEILAVSFSIITPIKKIEKSSGFLGTFSQSLLFSSRNWFIYLTLFNVFYNSYDTFFFLYFSCGTSCLTETFLFLTQNHC